MIRIDAKDGMCRTVRRWRGRKFVHYGTAAQIAASRYAAVITAHLKTIPLGAIEKAAMDMRLFGTGVVRVTNDGQVEHVPPSEYRRYLGITDRNGRSVLLGMNERTGKYETLNPIVDS